MLYKTMYVKITYSFLKFTNFYSLRMRFLNTTIEDVKKILVSKSQAK